jgi:hypothetical protein
MLLYFIDSSKGIVLNEKYKSHFHSERPYNSENKSENGVREGENLTQASLTYLTRLTLSKILLNSPYTIHTYQYL